MECKVTKSALACAALKAGQQVLHDMDSVVMNDTTADVARFAIEQYACRLGAPLVAAYALDKAIGYAEEVALPKYLRGVLPVAISTLGAGIAIHYCAEYMNMQAGMNFAETAKTLLENYADSISKFATLDLNANAGYLTGAVLSLTSGLRWIKNIGQSFAEHSENKKLKKKKLEEIAED